MAVPLLDAVSCNLESHPDRAMALRGSHVIASLASLFFFFTEWCLSCYSSQNQSSIERCLHMQISHHPAQAHIISQGNSIKPTVVSAGEPRTLSQHVSTSGVTSLPTLELHHWSAPSAAPSIQGARNSIELSNLLHTSDI